MTPTPEEIAGVRRFIVVETANLEKLRGDVQKIECELATLRMVKHIGGLIREEVSRLENLETELELYSWEVNARAVRLDKLKAAVEDVTD